MTHRISRVAVSALLVLVLAAAFPPGARATSRSTSVAGHQASAVTALFLVGKAGDNLWPLSLTIYSDGTVKGFWTIDAQGRKAAARAHLSQYALNGVMRLAHAEGFFSMPSKIGSGPAKSASRFITIRNGKATKTVSGRGAIRSAAFSELYDVLLAVSGAPCTPARQCGV
ncbi:MAG TPA: hypothetical protein VKX16_05115 [Chloroflexota bacterium]|nr:hypothetical protein [Chloroflexota bacterium]